MTINKFIKICKDENSPIGDLANDILRDEKFPYAKTDTEIFEYLNFKTQFGGTNETFIEFLNAYNSFKSSENQVEIKVH